MSAVSRRLLLALRLLALALIALFVAAPLLTEQTAWGLWPATYLPPAWRWGLALLAAVLALFGDRLALGRLAAWPRPTGPQVRLGLALLTALPFYLFRVVHTRWGDAYILVNSIPHPQAHLTYTWQAPLDVFLHAKAWAAGHVLFGWPDAMPAYWLISTAAGVLFVWVLLGLAQWLARDAAERWLLVGLVATLGTMQLFFGYIENYTLMTLGLLVYMALALRALCGEVTLFWPALALALTHALHPSTIVVAPSLLYLCWASVTADQQPGEERRRAGRLAIDAGRRLQPFAARVLLVAIPYALTGCAVLALMTAGGHGLGAFFGADAPGGSDHNWLVPLFATATRWERYTMFSLAHLGDIANEQALVAPAILPGLALVACLAWPRVRAAFGPGSGQPAAFSVSALRFLALVAGLYLLLAWTWNPDYGGQRDWDLFAPAAVPAALLLGVLLPRVLPERAALRGAAWALVTAQALHTLAWIYQNTQPWSWT